MSGSSISFDNQDPILRSIAQELHSSLNQDETSHASLCGTKDYDFQLQSLLTRPRNCTTLFPPRVLKEKRHQKITLQERLLLISVNPVEDPTTNTHTSTHRASKRVDPAATSSAVLVAGLEVLEYMLTPVNDTASDNNNGRNSTNSSNGPQQSPPGQERIIYIAKVDTSGCWPLPGLESQSLKSPAQALVKGYLRAMRSQGYECATGDINATDSLSSLSLSPSITEENQTKQQNQDQTSITRTSLFVFARAQPQYLFAESVKNIGKRVLDDRGLVRWWKNMITSAYDLPCSSPSTSTLSSSLTSKIQGWWLIPGIETERQALNVIQSKSPSRTPVTATSTTTGSPSLMPALSLHYGYSDKDSKEMAHTLIPQFPDDPKSRMMKSPSCQGGFVDIKTFWELAAIGEESGAGKITGFFKVVEDVVAIPTSLSISSESKSNTATVTPPPTTTATACVTGTKSDYTRAINFLLELDFSTHERAQDSTQQWLDRLDAWIKKAALKTAEETTINDQSIDAVNDVSLQIKSDEQLQPQDQPDDKRTEFSTTTPPRDHRSSTASPLWIQQGTIRIQLLQAHGGPAEQTSTSGSVPEGAAAAAAASVVVHTLNTSLIKRKSQQENQQQQQQVPLLSTPSHLSSATPAVNVLAGNLIKRKPAAHGSETPTVNVLGNNLIKRKPTATPATTTTTTITVPAATSDSSTPLEPTVNILGSSFIKKRKLDP
ncbi:hypothetical protein EC968_000715 [Mortierella alpina]|nr:hypothetical protein EC968_000715 [Mortierella alpina]